MSRQKHLGLRCVRLLALGAVGVLAGCNAIDGLLSVEAPTKVPADALRTPDVAQLLVRSSKNAFRCAFSNYVNVSGYVGPELAIAEFAGATIFYDQRFWRPEGYWAVYAESDCAGGTGLYVPLSRARWMGDDVLKSLDEWGPDLVPGHAALDAEAAAFTGYSYVLMGEAMCSVAFDSGPEQDVNTAFELAVSRFDRAIAAAEAAGQDRLVQLARVGKARALLNLRRLPEAAAVATLVPQGFRYEMDYSSGSTDTFNKVWEENQEDQLATVEEPYRNMSFAGMPDPRVRVEDTGETGAGTDVPVWIALKYGQSNSPIELASWEEAQLIVAEAALAAGRLQEAVDVINLLHAKVDLPPFASTSEAEIRDQIHYERRAELFLEGHQLGDIRRYDLPLFPAPGEPFLFGGTYSDQTCFPLPAVEYHNNPNLGGTA